MDFSNLSTGEKALLAAQSFNTSRAGGDGFVEALNLAEKMSTGRRQEQVKQQTGGFLQAVMGGTDPAAALAKFPEADQGMAGGFFQALRAEQVRKDELERARDERRTDATTAFDRSKSLDNLRLRNEQTQKATELALVATDAERKAQEVEAARPTIGAADVMSGTPAWSGAEPPSVDAIDRGFLAQIAAQPTTAVGRQAARTQMLAERGAESVMDKRASDAATAEERAKVAAATAAATQKATEEKLAETQRQFDARQATAEQLAGARSAALAAQTQASLAQIELAKIKSNPGYIEWAAKAQAAGTAAGTPAKPEKLPSVAETIIGKGGYKEVVAAAAAVKSNPQTASLLRQALEAELQAAQLLPDKAQMQRRLHEIKALRDQLGFGGK